ncbi:indole-3-acetaldehyde oxidase-like [Pararge aegeria]|uniref:indole-3-acetaldehyde oxidase-like n=1 Tax=Pararge aegeria TaxID=116150 RepID=UPI0019D307FA|nr:indole-3-acetaldehyde oxidase-like [Pararge aegeria]
MDRVNFSVNGANHSVGCEVRSTTTLLEYLRHHLELRGTKYKCLEGGCGSCIVSAVKRHGDKPQGVNSCMVSITSCKDWEITTIEKVGNRLDGYHPLQTTLAAKGGSQCGYCSPGMIMNIYSYLKAKPRTMREIEHALGSNLCRCTGYRPILEAFKTFASDAPKPTDILDIEDLKICKKSGESCSGLKCEHSDWCIVPKHNEVLHIKLSDDRDWYRVASLIDVFNIWEKNGTECYMLINGNTGKGVYPILEYPKLLIDISGVSELKGYYIDQNLVLLGGTTLVEVLHIFKTLANNEGFCYLNVLADHLEKVAHVTVRNVLGSDACSTDTLTDFMRYRHGLHGTKYMCREGGCGACMVSVVKSPGQAPMSVNSCLVGVASCSNWEITTIEGLGNRLKGYHPLQKALAKNNGSQCGYCSPGMIMNMYK